MKINKLVMIVMGFITTFSLNFYATSKPEDQSFQKKIYEQYLEVKNALVKSDQGKAKERAEGIVKLISKMSADEKKSFSAYASKIKLEAEKIASSRDIDEQRKTFSNLSDLVYNMVKENGVGTSVYYQHCPMALNNSGASWLSEMKEIRNPYFGDAMLKCGSIKESITK